MARDEAATRARTARGRLIVLVLAALYLALAVIGFLTVGLQEFGPEEPVRMLGFLGVSTLLSIVHTVLGVVLGIAGLRGGATAVAPVLVIVFVAMAVFGAVAQIFGGTGDPLNLDWWNVGLYVASGLACAYVYASG